MEDCLIFKDYNPPIRVNGTQGYVVKGVLSQACEVMAFQFLTRKSECTRCWLMNLTLQSMITEYSQLYKVINWLEPKKKKKNPKTQTSRTLH